MEKERPYLPEATPEDYKESIRELAFEDLPGSVENLEELEAMLEEKEKEADSLVGRKFEFGDDEDRERKEEVAIMERVPGRQPHHDFYIARRQRTGKVFEPETVIVAKSRGKTYLVKYAGQEAESFEAIDERRFLEEFVNPNVEADSQGGLPVEGGAYVMSEDHGEKEVATGGMGKVIPVLYRRREKMLPEAGVRKEPLYDFDTLQENLEVNMALKRFLEREADRPGAEYFVRPLGGVEANQKNNVLYEMAESRDGVAGDLWSELKDEKIGLTPDQKMTVALQMFTALGFMNERGFRHNDVKPANILLGRRGIKLCDYGLTTFRQEDADEERRGRSADLSPEMNTERYQRGSLIGTIPYVHPHMENRFGHRNTDTFGAAVTAYALLTHRNPRGLMSKSGGVMGYISDFRSFKESLVRNLDQALDSEDYAHFDREKLAALSELIKSGLELPDDGDPPGAADFVAALRDLGVTERMDLEPEGQGEGWEGEDGPTQEYAPKDSNKDLPPNLPLTEQLPPDNPGRDAGGIAGMA